MKSTKIAPPHQNILRLGRRTVQNILLKHEVEGRRVDICWSKEPNDSDYTRDTREQLQHLQHNSI